MSHYIRTIHTDFTRSAPPYAGSSAAAHAGLLLNLGGLMQSNGSRYPPGLGHSDWRSPSGPQPRRRRSAAISIRSPTSLTPAPSARRALPPPPPRTSYAYQSQSQTMKFDPFSDDAPDYSAPPPPSPILSSTPLPLAEPVLYRTPRTAPASLTASSAAPTVPRLHAPSPPAQRQPQAFDPNARSRLVAGILLNRVHAVGRPMRRRSFDGPREYVKSGLSSVVCVEA